MNAEGKIYGRNKTGDRITSNMSEMEAEGRLGFTFQPAWCFSPYLIPFVGYGFYEEINKFRPPSPMTVHFLNTFEYAAFGFITRAYINDSMYIGLNFTAKYSLDCKSKISNDPDPDIEDIKLQFNNAWQYEINFPFALNFKAFDPYWECCQIELTPFYRYRHYGERENFPYDFLNTQFNSVGAKLLFSLWL